MAKKQTGSVSKGANMITWRRLPKGVEIKASGPKSPQLARLMKDAGLNPRPDCYGGDTCIA